VVINNAGYGLFGALWVTKAALPIMRAQRSGHIIQVPSIGGVNAFRIVGLYHASKWVSMTSASRSPPIFAASASR
jgi:NADP-dependent 3-hydroxy acid dehydrogenase YdfG